MAQDDEGRALLTRYWEAHAGEFPRPYLIEAPFRVAVGGWVLAGRIDRVDTTTDGYDIVDYKLAARGGSPPDPLQLELYQLGFHAMTGHEARTLAVYALREGGYTRVVSAGLPHARARVAALCSRISQEVAFRPREGPWCARCP